MPATLVSIKWIRNYIFEATGRSLSENAVGRMGSRGYFGEEIWERGRKKYRLVDTKRGVKNLPANDRRRKLSDDQVVAIREDASGETHFEIGKRFGITEGYVSLIRSGKRRAEAKTTTS